MILSDFIQQMRNCVVQNPAVAEYDIYMDTEDGTLCVDDFEISHNQHYITLLCPPPMNEEEDDGAN